MEINITKFYNEAAPKDFAASVAEIGEDAGKYTWQAAIDDAPKYNMLDTPEKIEEFKSYIEGFGTWPDEEIAAWSGIETNALFIQMVSTDLREKEGLTWEEYHERTNCGNVSGRVFQSDSGDIYYYVG